jgi:signal transduction histidine kinase
MNASKPTTVPLPSTDEQSLQIRNMLSAVSHDVSSPIRAVVGFADLMRSRAHGKLDEEELRWLELISTEGQRAQHMLGSLSTFSNLMVAPLKSVKIDIESLLNCIGKRHACALNINIEALPQIEGDMNQWCQLFDALISNAIRFQSPDRPLHVSIRCHQDADQRVLQIVDNGIGVKQRDFVRIVLPFFRTQQIADLTDLRKGMGMGLAYCDQIIKRHGGYLSFAANPDHGLTVNCHLPNTTLAPDRR